jgi:transposase
MTDAQWAVIEPLLPAPGNTGGRGGRPEKHPRRLVLDAIFYLVAGRIAWAALPHDFPPCKTVYGIFRRWAKAGAACPSPRVKTGPPLHSKTDIRACS